MVEKFLHSFPKYSSDEAEDSYHQLQGNLGLRCALNSVRIRNCLVTYCQGNVYMKAMPLRNITSSVLLTPAACDDILYYPEKGQQGYEDLIKTRLLPTSTISIWDTLPQLKLTRFMTWIKKKTIKVGDKVIKLREDRQLYSQIINIAQKRPEIITGMQHLVSEYEMSIVPRANFNPDGSMLLCLDKASLMKSIRAQPPTIEDISSPEDRTQVMIVDGMVDVNCLKKRMTPRRCCR